MFYIKIVKLSDNTESIINKFTTQDTFLLHCKEFFDIINAECGIASEIYYTNNLALNIFNIYSKESIVKKGWVYNSTENKDKKLYILSLIKINVVTQVSTETQTENTWDFTPPEVILEEIATQTLEITQQEITQQVTSQEITTQTTLDINQQELYQEELYPYINEDQYLEICEFEKQNRDKIKEFLHNGKKLITQPQNWNFYQQSQFSDTDRDTDRDTVQDYEQDYAVQERYYQELKEFQEPVIDLEAQLQDQYNDFVSIDLSNESIIKDIQDFEDNLDNQYNDKYNFDTMESEPLISDSEINNLLSWYNKEYCNSDIVSGQGYLPQSYISEPKKNIQEDYISELKLKLNEKNFGLKKNN